MSLPRGFEENELRARVSRAQALMNAQGISALLLTREPDVRYFTGFLTRFWESPSRPWFLVLPAMGDPIAVIPSIGRALMAKTWLTDIRTWVSPDPVDDGVSLLADTLREVAGFDGRIGVPSGPETHLRMPLHSFSALQVLIAPLEISRAEGIMRTLRSIKSEAEIAKISHACDIAGRAFSRVPEIARAGVSLEQVFRRFQVLCLEEGADWVPYLAGGAGPMGYDDVISPAGPQPLLAGDVLMLDTGLVWDGYFCDFDRNYAIGPPAPEAGAAHAQLVEAAHAGLEAAKPGMRASELWQVLADVCGVDASFGRLGHGVGMQLTEGLSLSYDCDDVLRAGMVITLEPGVELQGGGIMVHEENVVIRPTGAEPITRFAKPKLPEL